MRLARRVGVLAAAGVAGTAAVLAVEIQLARSGSRLPDLQLVLDRPGSGRRLVWLGDSTAAGVGASTSAGALPTQVADGLGAAGASVAVLAVSGARVADVLADQVPKVAGLQPNLVLISVGANDTIHLTGRGAFRHTYEQLVRALPPGVPVVLLGVPDMGAIPRFAQPLRAVSGWRGRNLDAEVRRVAARARSRLRRHRRADRPAVPPPPRPVLRRRRLPSQRRRLRPVGGGRPESPEEFQLAVANICSIR